LEKVEYRLRLKENIVNYLSMFLINKSYNMSRSFTDLDVYKECRKFRLLMQKVCDDFPNDEKYKLKDQLVRSSRSITANIAEGHGRFLLSR
jgi:hypothetical protein